MGISYILGNILFLTRIKAIYGLFPVYTNTVQYFRTGPIPSKAEHTEYIRGQKQHSPALARRCLCDPHHAVLQLEFPGGVAALGADGHKAVVQAEQKGRQQLGRHDA